MAQKERPILFSTPMVQAILSGRKTQTRRAVKGLSVTHTDNKISFDFRKGKRYAGAINCDQCDLSDNFFGITSYCPFGNPGDLIYVKETYFNDADFEEPPIYVYKADNENYPRGSCGWKPSLFMPKAAARIWLEITGVRVERVNDISEHDAINEGIKPVESFNSGAGVSSRQMYKNYLDTGYTEVMPKDSFESLWCKINGEESWKLNPWVWIIEFKRIEK